MNANRFNDIICPKCSGNLYLDKNCLKCENGHCYDVSSKGYVNLLPPHKQGTIPGDNKEMVQARRAFLAKGYYEPLANKIYEIMKQISPEFVVDIGCGEGYYTGKLLSNAGNKVVGFDISKFALAYAAKLYKDVAFCVANLHDIPLKSESCDAVLCCFCACDEVEFARILKKCGKFVLVTPGKRHLFGLKSILYDCPYENDTDIEFDRFKQTENYEVSYNISVEKGDIWNLFSMTPYYWKTSKEASEKLKNIDVLCTEANFLIRVYQKT